MKQKACRRKPLRAELSHPSGSLSLPACGVPKQGRKHAPCPPTVGAKGGGVVAGRVKGRGNACRYKAQQRPWAIVWRAVAGVQVGQG